MCHYFAMVHGMTRFTHWTKSQLFVFLSNFSHFFPINFQYCVCKPIWWKKVNLDFLINFFEIWQCVLLWLSHKRNVTLCLKRSINWAYNMQANSESLSWLASFGETTMTRKHGGSKLFWTLGSMPEDNRYVDNRFHHQQQQHSHTHGIKRLVRFSQNH